MMILVNPAAAVAHPPTRASARVEIGRTQILLVVLRVARGETATTLRRWRKMRPLLTTVSHLEMDDVVLFLLRHPLALPLRPTIVWRMIGHRLQHLVDINPRAGQQRQFTIDRSLSLWPIHPVLVPLDHRPLRHLSPPTQHHHCTTLPVILQQQLQLFSTHNLYPNVLQCTPVSKNVLSTKPKSRSQHSSPAHQTSPPWASLPAPA